MDTNSGLRRAVPIRVFILVGHELGRQALTDLLESEGFEVAGASPTATGAAQLIRASSPDVVIVDCWLPDGTGIEACRDVRSIAPDMKCLLLTSYDDDQAVRGAVLAGASGYVLNQIAGNTLVSGIRAAAAGQSLFGPGVRERTARGLLNAARALRTEASTYQQGQVLDCIGRGLTNREIGEEMSLAETTVRIRIASVLGRLGYR